MTPATLVAWTITVIVVAVLATFAAATVSLHRLPTDHRPHTPLFDRFGREIGMAENPDYTENPGRHQKEETGDTSKGEARKRAMEIGRPQAGPPPERR